MNIGEICKLKIESRLAYGSKGLPPLIPGNTSVVYDVELISVEPETDPETLTITQRKIMGYVQQFYNKSYFIYNYNLETRKEKKVIGGTVEKKII